MSGGCGDKHLPTVPVEGKVLYKGKPLEFGSVLFQPNVGPPAKGVIGPDGSFHLSTYRDGDGAVIGSHHVRIACFETQKPSAPAGETANMLGSGKSLIPSKYTNPGTSGLTVEVTADTKPVVLDLADDVSK